MDEKIPEKTDTSRKQTALAYVLVELGIEFALMIGLPLGAAIYFGKWLDAKYNHHFFVLIGIFVALALSCYMIYRKINEVKNLMK